MGEINVTGLGIVRIQGDEPTPEEEQAIIDAIQGTRPAPVLADPSQGLRLDIEGNLRPEAQLLPNPTPFLEETTGGFVSRGASEALGATVGMAVGAGAGLATGPSAPVASPAGAFAGAVAGAGAGSAVFDVADDIARAVKGLPPREGEFFDPAKRSVRAMKEEFLFTGGISALGPVIKAFKPAAGKVLGVGSDTVRRLARTAEAMDIPLGILQASKSKAVKGASRVLGVFPFVGTPIKKSAVKTAGALDSEMASILNELAPNATISELGVDLASAAQGRFKKFRRIAAVLYDRFNTLADNASTKEIIPTEETGKKATELLEALKSGKIELKSGEKLISPLDDPLGGFIEQLTKLPEALTAKQARQLQRELQDLATTMQRDGFDLSRIVSIKKALESDLNNILTNALPEGEAAKLVNALTKANKFYAETIRRFQTVTAKRFARVDKNIFAPGAFRAGTVNADEVFSVILNSRSPQALADLRSIVGRKEFLAASRKFLEKSYANSLTSAGGKAVSFDVDKFANLIGLGTKEGKRGLSVMLSGSEVTVQNMQNFVDVARAAGSIIIPDTSVFLARRLTLSGVRNIMGGFALGAAGITNPIETVVAVLLTRQGAKILSNPRHLKALTTALKDTVPDMQRRSLVLRVARQVLDDDTEQEGAER